jgi:NADH pyrophosphatase NudC (nudix superfamily)
MTYCQSCGHPLEPAEVDGRTRMRCGACGWVLWDNPVPVVAAIVEHEGSVVLVRSHGWPEKFYGLVTGFLERDESPEEGVLREVREELSLEGRVASLVGVYPFKERNQVIIAYHVEAAGEIVLGEELEAFKRIEPAKLRPWPRGTGHAVRDWLERRSS